MRRIYKRDWHGRFASGGGGGKGKKRTKKGSRRTQRRYDKAVYNRSIAASRRQSVKDNKKYGAGNTKGQIRRAERKNVRLEKSAARLEHKIKGKKLRKGSDKNAAYDRHWDKKYRRIATRRALGHALVRSL